MQNPGFELEKRKKKKTVSNNKSQPLKYQRQKVELILVLFLCPFVCARQTQTQRTEETVKP